MVDSNFRIRPMGHCDYAVLSLLISDMSNFFQLHLEALLVKESTGCFPKEPFESTTYIFNAYCIRY